MTITEDRITSTTTEHLAWRGAGGWWRVSWLPARDDLTRNQAISAMLLVETAVREEMHADNRYWPAVASWAKELGLSGPDAVVRATANIDPETLVDQNGMLPTRDLDE